MIISWQSFNKKYVIIYDMIWLKNNILLTYIWYSTNNSGQNNKSVTI